MSQPNLSTESKPAASRFRRGLSGFQGFREGTTIVIIVVLGFVMSLLSPYFLTGDNFRNLFMLFAINGFVAIGMTLVLISGGIDLSVGSVVAFVGVVTGSLFFNAKMNIWMASLIGVAVGTGCGFITGFFVTRIGLSAFITTLGMMQVARGATFVISAAMPIPLQSMPTAYKFLGRGIIPGVGIPFVIVLFIASAVVFDFLSRRSTGIRRIYYVGSNEKAARFSGVNVNRVRMGVYVLSAALASVAGVLTIARFNSATPVLRGHHRLRDHLGGGDRRGQPQRRGRHHPGGHPGNGPVGADPDLPESAGRLPVLAEPGHRPDPAGRGVHRLPEPPAQGVGRRFAPGSTPAPYFRVRPSLPRSTTAVPPSLISPASTLRARGFCTRFWMVRFRGRAPYSGSKPVSAR